MKKNGYYTSTTLVGWRPVVFGPNEETYQVKIGKNGKVNLRRINFVPSVLRYLEAFIRPAFQFEGLVIHQPQELPVESGKKGRK